MKRNIYIFLFFVLIKAGAQTEGYTYHAMFIHNFVKYIEWPAGKQPIVVGVLNNQEAVAAISQVGSAMQVKNLKKNDDFSTCSLVFIPSNSSGQLDKVLDQVKNKPVLVVTESAGLTQKGASISFKLVDNKMKFQINESAIKSVGLKVSSSLVTLAVK
jgi:hypothetical protein